ncbi:MAG: thioredoxin domain-containing protein [Pontixanthobacter sp.]
MNTILRNLGLAVVATLTIGNSGNWNTRIDATDRVHTIGNPEAETTLTEFVSYTCPHCATFAIEGEAPLQLAYIGSGKVRLEMRSFVRNVVDLTATMLVQCGDTDKFLQNHTMFMMKQSEWLEKARRATPSQQAIWVGPDKQRARQNMAQTLGFYDMMATRGYERPQVDRCLADQDRADTLVANTRLDATEFGVRGTPSFVLNGDLLQGVHNWETLETALNAELATR